MTQLLTTSTAPSSAALGRVGEQALKHAPRDPDHAFVLADLDPELHGLPLGIPVGVLVTVKI
jgi:hypothetical protein